MNILHKYGWGPYQQQHFQQFAHDASPGRVISILGTKYLIITEKGEMEAELSGKVMYGSSPDALPKVGDWVSFMDYGSQGYILDVFPRSNALMRKAPSTTNEVQVLATNIDMALIVQGLDRDFNLMRLDRYLVQLATCQIQAAVILNKTDLTEDPLKYRAEVERLQRDCRIYMCSTNSGSGLEEIQKELLQAHKTFILIGSSGAGKSSLLNALSGSPLQKTRGLSKANQKGTHTTTSRHLFQLADESLVIDTPGMREFGITNFVDGSGEASFPTIHEFASLCRYKDCRHLNESGCAVLQALASGALDERIYLSYRKLLKEQDHFGITAEEKKRMGKRMGKMMREADQYRKKYKF